MKICTSHIPSLDGVLLPTISSLQTHVNGVTHLLQNINAHKATGPDNLPACFLNKVAKKIRPVLTVTFQASLNQETLTCIWEMAAVIKKGSQYNPFNLRPIFLTFMFVKLLEHIIYIFHTYHYTYQCIRLCTKSNIVFYINGRFCKTDALTRGANVMSYYWTLVRCLIKFPTFIYVIHYVIIESMVHFYSGFKLFFFTQQIPVFSCW